MTSFHPRKIITAFAFIFALAACGSSTAATVDAADPTDSTDSVQGSESAETESSAESEPESATDSPETEAPTADDAVAAGSELDLSLFLDGALVGDATTIDCTLSDGAETTCYQITVAGDPVSYETGPFCPETTSDSADAGGIWFDGNGVYDVDGDFITGLAELYDDDNWKMYDDDGNVLVVESAEEFDLAARPDVDPSLQNHCVEGRVEWLENGEPVTSTVVIPVQPVLASASSASNGNSGVTLDGVVIAASAPVDAILSAYTIAAFDDCGGHYNPTDGYHLHGAVGCSEIGEATDGETPMFAYAMDGFPVHSPLDDASSADLNECNGHETEADGYHYHANGAEQNQVIECLIGQTVSGGDDDRGGRPDGPPPGAEDE